MSSGSASSGDSDDDGYQLPSNYSASFHPPSAVHCPTGYLPVFEQCYRLVGDQPLPTGDDAQETCNAVLNGTLAEAKDDFTNGAIYDFTRAMGRANGSIIGVKCKRRGCKKLFTTDGDVPQTFKAWAFKEPSGQPLQLCVITNFRSRPGAWNNINCNCLNSTYPCRFQAVCQTRSKLFFLLHLQICLQAFRQ